MSMQLWFSHRSGISLREQLVTQVVLGILSGDLRAGERLPSTRELARRFRLHANTASAGYRQLERERWVEYRHGSGVYVREQKGEDSRPGSFAVDQLAANFFRCARELGIPLATVRSRMNQLLAVQPADHFLVVERDEELRRILMFEVEGRAKLAVPKLPVRGCSPDNPRFAQLVEGSIPLALAGSANAARKLLPPGTELQVLQVRSVPVSLAEWLPAPAGALVGIASRWPGFLKLARTMLAAAGFERDGLVFRDARKRNWQRGLEQAAAVICDVVTSAETAKQCRTIAFPLLAEASLAELRSYEQFLARDRASTS